MSQAHARSHARPDDGSDRETPGNGEAQRILSRRVALAVLAARANLLWERLWPALLPFVCVAALFCTVSWLGVWPAFNPYLRMAIVAATAVVAIASLYPLLRVKLPTREQAVRRVEQATALRHRPISALRDTLSGAVSQEARTLWEAHKRRASRTIGRLAAGAPNPRVAERDPYALRTIVLLAFIVSAAFAGNARMERLLQAFQSPQAQLAAATRLDAWVSPPSYTARPPVLLTGDLATDTVISVPEGSKLIVRSQDAADITMAWSGDDGAQETVQPERSQDDATLAEMARTLTGQRLRPGPARIEPGGPVAVRDHRRRSAHDRAVARSRAAGLGRAAAAVRGP